MRRKPYKRKMPDITDSKYARRLPSRKRVRRDGAQIMEPVNEWAARIFEDPTYTLVRASALSWDNYYPTAPLGWICPRIPGDARYPELQEQKEAWLVAHAFARELNVSPMEALLTLVRISAGRVAWLEWKLGTLGQPLPHEIGDATAESHADGRTGAGGTRTKGVSANDLQASMEGDDAFMPGGAYHPWVVMSQNERDRLAKVSQLAIASGVAKMLVEQETQRGDQMAALLGQMLDSMLDQGVIDAGQEQRAIDVITEQLRRLDAVSATVPVEG